MGCTSEGSAGMGLSETDADGALACSSCCSLVVPDPSGDDGSCRRLEKEVTDVGSTEVDDVDGPGPVIVTRGACEGDVGEMDRGDPSEACVVKASFGRGCNRLASLRSVPSAFVDREDAWAVDELSDGGSESDAPPGLILILFFIFLMWRILCENLGLEKSVQRAAESGIWGWTMNAVSMELSAGHLNAQIGRAHV